MKKKQIAGWIVGIIIIFILILVSARTHKKQPETVKIGVLLPLTGPAAEYGQDALYGIKLAFKNFDNKIKYEMIVEDSKSNPKDALTAFKKLTEVDGVKFILGDIISGNILSIAPVANSKECLVFSPGASSPDIDDKDDNILRNWVSDTYDANCMAYYIKKDMNINAVFVVYVNNEYGRALSNSFKNYYTSLGGTITGIESFDEKARDFKTIIAKAIRKNPRAYYVIGYSNQTAPFIKQLGEMGGLKNSFAFTNLSAEDPQFSKIAFPFLDKVIYSSPSFDTESEAVKKFSNDFKNTFGTEPGIAAAHSYDATMILLNLIMEYGPNVNKVKKGILTTKDYIGISGTTIFTDTGDAIKDISIKKFIIINGRVENQVIKKVTIPYK